MDEGISYKQLIEALDANQIKTQAHFTEVMVAHQKLDEVEHININQKIDIIVADVDGVEGELYGNGKPGMKTIVDRLYQSRWWLRGLTCAVVAKVTIDIFMK